MIFQNLNQYEIAKKSLIANEGDINLVFEALKENKQFSDLSESELFSALEKLNEGLGDKILNFIGNKMGGDISKIKKVLLQMKEQELKFNKEENDIYNQFYSLLQDQRALEKDKKNPNYADMSRDLAQSRNALNVRMKELTKSHNDIFNALEEKTKGLVGNNKRKSKYFNAQRASDVLETRTDRYEKIKAITAKSAERSNLLNDFFGVNPDEVKKEVDNAKVRATTAINNLKTTTKTEEPKTTNLAFQSEPEKGYNERLQKIINEPGGYPSKKKGLEEIIKNLQDLFVTDEFKNNFAQDKKIDLHVIYNQTNDYIEQLEKGEKSVNA